MNAATAARQQVQAPSPPPTAHTLKPHHIHLLWAIWVLNRSGTEQSDLPKTWLLHMYRVILVEVAEVRQPATHAQLMRAFDEGSKAATPAMGKILQSIRHPTELFVTSTKMHDWFLSDLSKMVHREDDADDPARFIRRSLFGYFVRRCYVSYNKLSLEAASILGNDYVLWLSGQIDSSATSVRRGLLTNEYNLFKVEADKKEYATAADYEIWEHGLAVGDEAVASEHLRTFFEQHFHDGNDSGLRQHALLNLARMHYLRHEYVACRKLLQEGITTSRTCNDKVTLQHCIGLMNRLPTTEKTRKPPINDVQPDLHPWEVLADVRKLMTVSHQQPLSASFEKIAQAAILYDIWTNTHKYAVTEAEQWGSNCVQAVAWSMLGNMQLAEVEDTVVIAFTDEGGDDNARLMSQLNCAYRHARRGKYTEAIAMLIDPSVWSGLTIADCQLWASEIWHILVLRASRRGQQRLYHEFLLPQKPPGQFNEREYWFGSSTPFNSHIRDPLYEVISMREVKQAQTAIEPLLTSLWHSEFQQRFGVYRAALILLADVGLQFGLTRWSRRIVEEVMPQLITGDDLEQRAFACFTLARCILATEEPAPEHLRESLHYLIIAAQDYEAMEMYRALQDTLFLASVVYHNLGMEADRDNAARRYHEVTKEKLEVETTVDEPWIGEVLQMVAEISCALAAR